jgi:hypothetical protein
MVTANPMLPSSSLRWGTLRTFQPLEKPSTSAPALMVIPPNRTSLYSHAHSYNRGSPPIDAEACDTVRSAPLAHDTNPASSRHLVLAVGIGALSTRTRATSRLRRKCQ